MWQQVGGVRGWGGLVCYFNSYLVMSECERRKGRRSFEVEGKPQRLFM